MSQAVVSRPETPDVSSWREAGGVRHGLQLAVAVLVSYGVSEALRLPESFWAVMSALIVVRPSTGSTVGAGWDRVRGAVSGTVFGLAGVWLLHRTGLHALTAMLGIVAALAFASALVGWLRSAPISALIVVTSGGIAGHSALQVASLRAIEIVIGVAVGVAVAMVVPGTRASAQFRAACASVLRLMAERSKRSLSGEKAEPDGGKKQADPDADIRAALRELAILAAGADREVRLFKLRFARPGAGRKPQGTSDAERYARAARLVARIAQEAAMLDRLAQADGERRFASLWNDVGHAVTSALDGVAAAMAGQGEPRLLQALRDLCRHTASLPAQARADGDPTVLLAGPLEMLRRDLEILARRPSRS